MWKDFSKAYIRNNRASGRSIIVAAFISALFLSLLCDLFFNLWIYEMERIGIEEGDWQFRITGTGENPSLLMVFFLFIILIVSLSLILIIHNSFAVSMDKRVYQFGILSSIGATPRQIRICLMQEAAALCSIPILLGCLVSIPITYFLIQGTNRLAAGVEGRHEAVFQYHPLVFIFIILVSIITVLFSAWIPARKLSKLTPLQAIQGTEELVLKRENHSRILRKLFGVEGELAGNALKAQKKVLRTSTLSLTLSFLGFCIMLCFFTLSDISTKHTYFERYQNAWDVMVTINNTKINSLKQKSQKQIEEIRKIEDVESCFLYQKASAVCFLLKSGVSKEVKALGGLKKVAGNSVTEDKEKYLVQSTFVIMDDESFFEYCKQIGISSESDGSIVLNQIWDSANSNFRYKKFVPFLKEDQDTIHLQNTKQPQDAVDIPVLGFTQEPPVLREEYDDYALVQFVPRSFWNKVSPQIGKEEKDTYVRILARDGITLAKLNGLEKEITGLLSQEFTIESENRLQEKITDDNMKNGFKIVIGAFCFLLAIIGITNIFFYSLSFLRQRKKEFARYSSIGMTPESMRKMFFIEALVTAGRPILITLPLTILFTSYMIKASYLNPQEFLMEAPVLPIVLFIFILFFFVSMAYYIGGKRVLSCNLAEVLQNDCTV